MSKTRDEAVAVLTAPGAMFELDRLVQDDVPWRVFKNAPASMRDVLALTGMHGSKEFVVYDDERLTFDEHLKLACGLAQHLRDRYGIAKGDRVAISARNYPEWIVAFWATIALGAVAVPLNAWWTGAELEYGIADSGAKVIVVDGERWDRLRERFADLGLRGAIVSRYKGELPAGTERWEDLRGTLDRSAPMPAVEILPEDYATILYTSGTTGAPKGALATHRNHCTNIMNTMFMGVLGLEMAGAPIAPPSTQSASLQVFPFFHIGGLTGMYVAAAFGSKLVLMYKWDVERAIELIAKERITSTSLVPMLLRQVLESPLLDTVNNEALAGIASGGAPVPPDLIRRMQDRFDSRVSPANGYGLTETTSAIVINAGGEYFDHPQSIGRPVLGADIRIVAEDGHECAPGEVGELWIRGPNIVKGYWNKPDATAAAFTDGWFHSGDLGHWDDDGFLYVVDRLKDVVIRGGENVYSAEVEAVLFEHPAIADVAIVGLPHAVYGEEVAAVVELKPGSAVSAAELQEFVAGRLARFKVPSRIVFRDEPLPRTATGKVLKRDLRNELLGGATG